jgi:hypothetical protein
MSLQLLFWILMLFWLLFGFWVGRGIADNDARWRLWGGNLLLFLLFIVLGWQVFGAPVK